MYSVLDFIIFGGLVFSAYNIVSSAPQYRPLPTEPEEEALQIDQYLERFGYLAKPPPDVQHSAEAFEGGIRDFQRMMGLEVTGRMNEETVAKMMAPRCGLPDVIPAGEAPTPPSGGQYRNRNQPAAFHAPGYKWNKNLLTWRSENYSPDMSQDSQRRAFYAAFDHWSRVAPVDFQEIASGTADIMLKFGAGDHGDGPGNGFDGSGGVLAHAYYPDDGDTHFDEDEQWTENSYDGFNLMIVAAHEFGHALGLDHSSNPEALMAPTYQGFDPNFQLHTDDIGGIQSLYGVRNPETAPPRPAPTPQQATRPPATQSPQPYDPNKKPDTCSSKFDAILQAHDSMVYIFRGKWIWRVDDYYGAVEGFPKLIRKVYNRPPQNIGGAVYSWRTRYTYFFKGDKVFKYYGFERIQRVTITNPNYPTKIDAALITREGQIQLLSRDRYYIFDEYSMDLEDRNSYPMSQLYPGVPSNIEAALRLRDGYIYFFKGLKYRKFDEYYRRVFPDYPKYSHPVWMGPTCGGNFDPK